MVFLIGSGGCIAGSPVCGHKPTQRKGRTMVCKNCGLEAPRDLVPMYWAVKIEIEKNMLP
jgi:transposase